MIFSLTRSLDVDLVFENRSYKLGEIIEVKVELNARRDVMVRKGRVDLVYEVRWVAPDTDRHPIGRMLRSGPGGHVINSYSMRAPTRTLVEHKHSYVLGSARFLEHAQLETHKNGSYNVRIQIHKDDPPYGFIKGAAREWSLVAVLDVVRALDVKLGKDVKVTFHPTEG